MKTLLITGGSGFIGSVLIKKLRRLSGEYKIASLCSKEIEGVTSINHNNYTFNKNDFKKMGILQIDTLIHLGAFTPKSSEQANDISSCHLNIFNTIYLLENLPSIPKKIIYASTVDVYGLADYIEEDTITQPISLYGWSKLYCEKIIECFCIEKNIQAQILRIGHIYGRGEGEYQKVIPNTIKLCLANNSPSIYTDGKELRAYLHIDDCVQAIINAIDLSTNTGIINIVSDNSTSVLSVVNQIKNLINPSIKIEILNKSKSARSLTFNATKMRQHLWCPVIPFERGIEDEINYFRSLNE